MSPLSRACGFCSRDTIEVCLSVALNEWCCLTCHLKRTGPPPENQLTLLQALRADTGRKDHGKTGTFSDAGAEIQLLLKEKALM